MAKLKSYLPKKDFNEYRDRYKECIRILNGLEKTLERKLPERERKWQIVEAAKSYDVHHEHYPQGWPADE